MDDSIRDYISNIKMGKIREFDNMAVIPLFAPEFSQIEFLTLHNALKSDLIEICEIDKQGSVPYLQLTNHAEIPVLLLDGEELVGAKQNRVLNTTILIKENSKTHIPVSCTEEGRWSYTSPTFDDSNHLASSNVRRGKSVAVSQALKMNGEFTSDQLLVWDEIRNTSKKAKTSSATGALRDIYTTHQSDLSDYLTHFELEKDQNGVLILINGEVRGMEILSDASTYQEYHDKIIKSYALDAHLETEKTKNTQISRKTDEFRDMVAKSNQARHPSLGYGCDYRFENEYSVGSSLVHNETILHTTFFKKPNMANDLEVNMSRASSRAHFYDSI